MKTVHLRGRPMPPASLGNFVEGTEFMPERFAPAPEVERWLEATFLAEDGPLRNPDHDHLKDADVAVLWTVAENHKAGYRIAGTMQAWKPAGDAWAKARAEDLAYRWFRRQPEFLMTLDANYCAQADDASFCALVEHELYHIAKKKDAFGMPKFGQDGNPVLELVAHDVEEFIGCIRRYGVQPGSNVEKLVEAAKRAPEVSRLQLNAACGVCQLRVA